MCMYICAYIVCAQHTYIYVHTIHIYNIYLYIQVHCVYIYTHIKGYICVFCIWGSVIYKYHEHRDFPFFLVTTTPVTKAWETLACNINTNDITASPQFQLEIAVDIKILVQKTQKLSPITHSGHRRMAGKSTSDAFPLVFAQAYRGTVCTVFGHGEWYCLLNLAVVEAQANCGRKQESCSGAHAKTKSPVRKLAGVCLLVWLAETNYSILIGRLMIRIWFLM